MVAFELILRQIGDMAGPGERIAFDLSPGEEIVFGRAPEAEITIPDPKVSGRHGKLLCTQAQELIAFDSGSLNGTFVEGKPVDPKAGSAVTFGSQLSVGDYTLEIANPIEFETIRKSDVAGAKNALINDLEDAYGYGLDLDEPTRRSAMEAAVERVITGLNRRESAVLLETILEGGAPGAAGGSMTRGSMGSGAMAPGSVAPTGSPGRVGVLAPPLETSPEDRNTSDASRSSKAPYSSPSDSNVSPGSNATAGIPDAGSLAATVRALAAQLVPNKPLETDEDFETFCRLLQQLASSMLAWLAQGLQSRGVFAEEFGAEVTLVFQRSNNPLKAMTLEDLTEYLLDWRHQTNAETRSYYLESVLKDMSEHQIGMIAGVKEAITGILGQLAPERIEKLAESSKGWSKSVKVWGMFQQVHKELSEEQSKLFAEMITPAIQKGYLHQHGEDDNSSPPPG